MSMSRIMSFILWSLFLLTFVHSNTDPSCNVRSLTKQSLEEQRKRHTPLLYWFAGVSAEWVKYLVEQSTGHYAGSVVGFGPRAKGPRDCGLHSVLCDGTVEDVKIVSSAIVIPIAVTNRRRNRRMIGGGLDYGFRRVILLLYDPYRSMVDDFINLHNNNKMGTKLELETLSSSSSFNVTAFTEHVIRRVNEYQETMELFLEHVIRKTTSNMTIVRYEDLLNPQKRLQTMAQLLDFLLFPVDHERIRCAFDTATTTTFPFLHPYTSTKTISKFYQSLPSSIMCQINDQLHYFLTKFNYTERPMSQISTSTTETTCKLSERSQCATRYPSLKFMPKINNKTESKAHVILLSFPGSGNTWLRLLVEHATGYFSGSVDVNDAELMRAMPGESVCDSRVVFVKGHPGDLAINLMNKVWVTNRDQHHKCGEGGIQSFSRVIYLIRDARKAMIADFQRHVTESHTGYVVKSSETNSMTNGDVYNRSKLPNPSERSPSIHNPIKRPFSVSQFATYLDTASKQYEEKYSSLILPVVTKCPREDVLIVRFEDLLNHTIRTQTLQTVVNFLRLPNVDPSRLHCAFALAKAYRRPALDKITAPWAYPQLDRDPSVAVNNTVLDLRLQAHVEFTRQQQK